MLPNCCKRRVVEYDKIASINFPILPDEVVKDLSTDQKYLYEICEAVISGSCSSTLALKNPGPLSHARFLTTANSILRYYISKRNPSDNLKLLSKFIVTVFAPTWFDIKSNSKFACGPRNFFSMIQRIRENIEEDDQKILLAVLNRNSYFAHSENILLAMLVDEDCDVRKIAVKKIIGIRAKKQLQVRKFEKPKVNFAAQKFYEMIDLSNMELLFEPPLLRGISNEELQQCISSDDNFLSSMINGIPCHTQAAERMIKTVSEASHKVCGEKNRHGRVCAVLESRELLPQTSTKSDFKLYY